MIKIMIVDDMPIFLEYLRGCIDWEAYGFKICCEAHDGREALELFTTYYPDIVLTDITMPYTNGLELSEIIVANYPETSVILITGNNEFEYARKAVKIGVCDYIVKPFEKEELLLSLLKLQDNINRALELKTIQQDDDFVKKEEVLRRLIYSKGNMEESLALQQLGKRNIEFVSKYFLVYTIKIDLYQNITEYETKLNWEKIIVNMLGEMIDIDGTYVTFSDFENNIVSILNFDSDQTMKKFKEYEFQDLIKMVKDYLGLNITIGVSDYCYGIMEIQRGYYQSIRAIGMNNEQTVGKILDYKRLNLQENHEFYSWDVVDSINKYLDINDELALNRILNEELVRVEGFRDDEVYTLICVSLLSILLSNIVKNGREITAVFGNDYTYYELLRSGISNGRKKEFVIECYNKVIKYEVKNKLSKNYEVASRAKKFIEENYTNPEMGIADISKDLLVNQTYLRKMFKSEMNMTLSEYITKFRMEKAQKLIKDTDYKLFEIAEKVGYHDVSYFSKCFKKYYGISPKTVSK